MKTMYALLLRLTLSIVLAGIISQIFFKGIHAIKTPALAVIMFILAYLFEYTRKRDRG
jgi:hypothetical protein